jgi:hypothetical protein
MACRLISQDIPDRAADDIISDIGEDLIGLGMTIGDVE